jgi:glycopeptide antibiotics resistance protein
LTIQGFIFYSIILITAVGLILIENFQNSYASSKSNSVDLASLLPFNSHIADQANNGKVSSIGSSLPFP